MKTLGQLSAALVLTLMLSLSAFAGDIHCGRTGEMTTMREGEISTGKTGEISTTKTGEIPTPLTGQIDTMRTVPEVWALNLWLGVLSHI